MLYQYENVIPTRTQYSTDDMARALSPGHAAFKEARRAAAAGGLSRETGL